MACCAVVEVAGSDKTFVLLLSEASRGPEELDAAFLEAILQMMRRTRRWYRLAHCASASGLLMVQCHVPAGRFAGLRVTTRSWARHWKLRVFGVLLWW